MTAQEDFNPDLDFMEGQRQNNPGNKLFYAHVASFMPLYQGSTRKTKEIIREWVVLSFPGRFFDKGRVLLPRSKAAKKLLRLFQNQAKFYRGRLRRANTVGVATVGVGIMDEVRF